SDFQPTSFEVIEPYYNHLLNIDWNTEAVTDTTHGSNDHGVFAAWLANRSELESCLDEQQAWLYVALSCDTENTDKRKAYEFFVQEIYPKIAPLDDALNAKMLAYPGLDRYHEPGFDRLLRMVRNARELYREENIPLQTELKGLESQYGAKTGSLSIVYNGHEYTLPQAQNLLKSPDPSQREAVYRLIMEARAGIGEDLQGLMDRMLDLRHRVALNAGFANYRDYRFRELNRFEYGVEECETFHQSVRDSFMPLKEHMDHNKALINGLDRLRPWDLKALPAGLKPLQPFEGQKDLIQKSIAAFQQLDPFFGECLSTMDRMGRFDLESRKGKAPGGYNYPMMESGAPFVFMNATGSMEDLETMMHEGGHAVHSFLVHPLRLNVYRQTPSETAELASMSMELLSMVAYPHFFGNPEDLHRASYEQIQRALGVLPWIACIDAYQHWMYTHPGHSRNERSHAWKELLQQYTSPVVDWSGLDEWLDYQWQGQLHLFEMPFYYIEYGFAQIGALGVWRNCTSDPVHGLAAYREALALGNTVSINDVYRQAGVPFEANHAYVEELANWTLNKMQHHENHLHRT
ncbi:MAG: M3 family oligoendopeptidase, partial [Bacteroidia bacterium]